MFKMLTLIRLSDSLIYKHVVKLTQFTGFFILSQLIIYFNNFNNIFITKNLTKFLLRISFYLIINKIKTRSCFLFYNLILFKIFTLIYNVIIIMFTKYIF